MSAVGESVVGARSGSLRAASASTRIADDGISTGDRTRIVNEFRQAFPDFSLQPMAQHIERCRRQLLLKRIIDIVVASLLIAFTAPTMLLAALLIKITSDGPAIFKQARPGRGGRPFKVLKFRTMYVGPVIGLAEIEQTFAKPGELMKLANDPRVTPVGRVLRMFSIDELPQLFNVLSGSMSLIGPRPVVPHVGMPYPEFLEARSLVRPGISGLWQISGARAQNTNMVSMMAPDIEYIARYSLWLDLKIAAKTPRAVLFDRATV